VCVCVCVFLVKSKKTYPKASSIFEAAFDNFFSRTAYK
jgi:hypothetical protein